MAEERITHWRDLAKAPGIQTRMEAWIELPPKKHDHQYDIIYIPNGRRPPCQRKPGEIGWEPVE